MTMQMSTRRAMQRLIAVGVAVAAVASAAGCDLARAANTPEQPKPGGTLYVRMQADFAMLDPQRSYSANEADALRLITRTLTTYRSVPGAAGSEVVGDLATD